MQLPTRWSCISAPTFLLQLLPPPLPWLQPRLFRTKGTKEEGGKQGGLGAGRGVSKGERDRGGDIGGLGKRRAGDWKREGGMEVGMKGGQVLIPSEQQVPHSHKTHPQPQTRPESRLQWVTNPFKLPWP